LLKKNATILGIRPSASAFSFFIKKKNFSELSDLSNNLVLIYCIFDGTNENVFLNVNNLLIMSQSITTFIEEVTKKNQNEPEFYRQF
jgi:hypothetical protein